MDYEGVDSSSTDDDNSQPWYQHKVHVGGPLAANSRSLLSSAPHHQMMQSDIDFEIHNLERVAYVAVLRALKAQSDALTWEKEGLITELRKELRVSDDEHRELLSGVNSDNRIHRMRKWKEGCGHQSVATGLPQHVSNQVASPTVSASRRKQKTSVLGNSFGTQSPSLTQPLSSTAKRGSTSGVGGRRINVGQPGFAVGKHMQYQLDDHVSPGDPMDDSSKSIRDPLIGMRVMKRWPADNKFYEAVITEYNPVNGHHALVYNIKMRNATVEWIDLKEVPREDIKWVGGDPMPSQLGEVGASSGRRKGYIQDSDEIEIYHTGALIKRVEKVLAASDPDESELDKAKKLLEDHEQTLIEVIAKLTDACNADGEHPLGQEQSSGRQRTVDYRGPSKRETGGRAGCHGSGRL